MVRRRLKWAIAIGIILASDTSAAVAQNSAAAALDAVPSRAWALSSSAQILDKILDGTDTESLMALAKQGDPRAQQLVGFALVESRTESDGSVYTVLQTFPLPVHNRN